MKTTRRNFVGALSLAALAPKVAFGGVPRNEAKLRIACIGIGGRGKADLKEMQSHPAFQLTAVCDVDASFFPIANEFGEKVKTFQDYRKLFASAADDFDAVVIATPDHMHSPISMLAFEANKHIYLQKPLAQDIHECRKLADAAKAHSDLATQMGIQIHAHPAYRTAVAWIQSGLIGTVKEVHSWSGKGWGGEVAKKEATAPPAHLDWDLYVGVSPSTEYVEGYYHRGNWRKWFAFGTGTQGDMGCHIVDPVFSALKISEPTRVVSLGPKPFEKNFALISHVEYDFKGTQYTTDNLKLTWYNGSLRPQKLQGLPEAKLPHQGSVFVGDRGALILPHIGSPSVFTTDGKPMESLPAAVSGTNHFHDWIDAAIGKKATASAPFDYSGPLTETVLLGTIINRWPNQSFEWDSKQCKFSGEGSQVEEANKLLAPPYRTNW